MTIQDFVCIRRFNLSVVASLFICNWLFAQDLEPRAYANIPKGVNIIVATYSYVNGNILTEPTLPIDDFIISSNNLGAGYMRSFGLGGKLARIQVAIPYVFMDGEAKVSGERITGSRTGLGDLRFRIGVNLLGSPALDAKEFRKYEQKTIFGASFVVSVPTGIYYPEKRINIGANRWGFKPELGISKRFEHVYAEFYSGIWFYTTNDEFLGNNTLKEKPVYTLQGHASYFFKNQMWVAVNLNWFSGGKTFVDQAPAGSVVNSSRIGGTFSMPLTKMQSVKLQFNTGIFKNIGLDYDSVSLGYQYVFL